MLLVVFHRRGLRITQGPTIESRLLISGGLEQQERSAINDVLIQSLSLRMEAATVADGQGAALEWWPGIDDIQFARRRVTICS